MIIVLISVEVAFCIVEMSMEHKKLQSRTEQMIALEEQVDDGYSVHAPTVIA